MHLAKHTMRFACRKKSTIDQEKILNLCLCFARKRFGSMQGGEGSSSQPEDGMDAQAAR